MKILESRNEQLENVLENTLSPEEMNDINGGWCFILFCNANFSLFFLLMQKEEVDAESHYV